MPLGRVERERVHTGHFLEILLVCLYDCKRGMEEYMYSPAAVDSSLHCFALTRCGSLKEAGLERVGVTLTAPHIVGI